MKTRQLVWLLVGFFTILFINGCTTKVQPLPQKALQLPPMEIIQCGSKYTKEQVDLLSQCVLYNYFTVRQRQEILEAFISHTYKMEETSAK